MMGLEEEVRKLLAKGDEQLLEKCMPILQNICAPRPVTPAIIGQHIYSIGILAAALEGNTTSLSQRLERLNSVRLIMENKELKKENDELRMAIISLGGKA